MFRVTSEDETRGGQGGKRSSSSSARLTCSPAHRAKDRNNNNLGATSGFHEMDGNVEIFLNFSEALDEARERSAQDLCLVLVRAQREERDDVEGGSSGSG